MRPSDEHHDGPARPRAPRSGDAPPTDDRLRAVLRAEAAAHRPDREAMLARVTTSVMSEPMARRRGGSRLRLALVGALVAVFGGGGVAAQWALTGDGDRNDATPVVTVTATTPATTPATPPPATGRPAPSSAVPSGTPPTSSKPAVVGAPATSPAAVRSRPGNTRVEQGPLWSDGSVDAGGGSSVVTLRTGERITALTVTIRLVKTPGLVSRGGTKSVPGASVTTKVEDRGDALLYTFTLSSADRVAPGTYTFTAKYVHADGGRDAGGDTYEAVATTAGGQSLDVYGDFYPAG
ncbi:MANSC domain-containing protein 1 [Actinoplanes sp. SE50]|uniref:hypothetical protein n=1 Tax=unclassified Actinoplanes TaxID=2626549 RepID=UPI00023ED13C|nr:MULTISPECIES: hypothetical protein [unclassified Actinoplanes]AEV87803.1 MANSC domain-containing protein 1 [Actinoplanes sp. SE50/110]ATO86205.1 MANSC domain-containing protein 1 [Actinoplanes sp. SE50]SLM03619.1 hypothetical protein ACSP50_6912 [Actinoplanes sp. SE50/110]